MAARWPVLRPRGRHLIGGQFERGGNQRLGANGIVVYRNGGRGVGNIDGIDRRQRGKRGQDPECRDDDEPPAAARIMDTRFCHQSLRVVFRLDELASEEPSVFLRRSAQSPLTQSAERFAWMTATVESGRTWPVAASRIVRRTAEGSALASCQLPCQAPS